MKIYNLIPFSIMVVMVLAAVLTLSCKKSELEVQQEFPFEVTVMPLPEFITSGVKQEIRIRIRNTGEFTDDGKTLRFFQHKGLGVLSLEDNEALAPNELYPIPHNEFKLYYQGSGRGEHLFDVWIADKFENEKKLTFKFFPHIAGGKS